MGRVMQGEKGIGRFAMFKIASTARVVTRAIDSADEFVIDFDLSFLDEATRSIDSPEFVDEINVGLSRRAPVVFDGVNPEGLSSNARDALGTQRLEVKLDSERDNRNLSRCAAPAPSGPSSGS